MRKKFLFYCLMFIVTQSFSVYLTAQTKDYIFEHISRADGLSNASVSSIVQDKYGFLWFGTQGGLNKFDGKKFTVYQHEPFNKDSLPHNLIQTMYIDRDLDLIWLGTYQGLVKFDIKTEEFTHFQYSHGDSNTISHDVVTAITRDRDGDLWVGTLNGLNQYHEQSNTFTRYQVDETRNSINFNIIRALHIDENNNIWIGGNGGLNRYSKKTHSFSHYRYIMNENGEENIPYVMSIAQKTPGILYLACWGLGISFFDIESGNCSPVSLEDNRLYSLIIDKDNIIWAGTWGGGLFTYNIASDTVTRYTNDAKNPTSISYDLIYSLFEDESGLIWIGTNGDGINKVNKEKQDFMILSSIESQKNALPKGKINALLHDSRGDLWIGVYNGGVSRFIPPENRLITYRADGALNSLSNDIINEIFEDSKGTVWIATNDGLNRFNPVTQTFTVYSHDENRPSLAGNIIYSIEECIDGKIMIGYHNNGFSIWDLETDIFQHYKHNADDETSISDNLVRDILCDSEGSIWLATNKGLNIFNPQTEKFERHYHNPDNPSTISTNSIGTLYEDINKNIWIGTIGGGLNKFNREDNTFNYYTTSAGLSDNTVLAIQGDAKGRIWCATSYGISIFDSDHRNFITVNEEDGLWGMDFNDGTTFDNRFNIYFGSTHGVYRFDSSYTATKPYKAPVFITDIEVFNKDLELGYPVYLADEIVLSHKPV
jgi:ligand-binding sensor domain-containing protein